MARRSKLHYISEEEYLQAEEKASIRHEYVDGAVFAMTGATDAHNVVAGNIFSFIHARLRGGPCRVYMNDMKVRIQSVKSYYYPDIMVSCEPFEAKSVFKNNPLLLIEVLSPSTTQIDRREKLLSYKKIASLKEYVVVYQDRQRVELYRRESDTEWDLIIFGSGEDLVVESLPESVVHIPFDTVYEGYNPPSRIKESESSYQIGWMINDLVDA